MLRHLLQEVLVANQHKLLKLHFLFVAFAVRRRVRLIVGVCEHFTLPFVNLKFDLEKLLDCEHPQLLAFGVRKSGALLRANADDLLKKEVKTDHMFVRALGILELDVLVQRDGVDKLFHTHCGDRLDVEVD